MRLAQRRWLRRLLVVGGLVCLWAMAEGGGPLLALGLHPMPWRTQAALFAAGVVLLALGLGGMPRPVRRGMAGPWPLVAITLVGFGLRVINLEDAVHVFVDEMHFAEGVVRLRDAPDVELLGRMSYIAAFPHFYAVLQTFSTQIFGPSLTALRLVSVFTGTLTIPAVYLLARARFDRPTALLAALLLASFPPHLHFSRLALNNIADPLFGVLALAFFAVGLRQTTNGGKRHHVTRAAFVLAGVNLGLTQYWYEGGRVVFPLVMALWLAALALTGRLPRRADLGAFLLAAFAAALPLYYVLLAWRFPLLPRLLDEGPSREVLRTLLLDPDGAAQLGLYVENRLLPALAHFVVRPEGGVERGFYYGGQTALLLPVMVPFFLVGVAVLLWRGRWLFPVLLVLVAVGNSVIENVDWSARYVVAFPALVITAAVGLCALWRWLFPARIRALGVVAVGLAIFQVAYYFGPHLTFYNVQVRPQRDYQDVGFRALDFPPDTEIYVFGDELTFPPHLAVMADYWRTPINVRFLHPLHLMQRGVSRLPSGMPLALFVEPDDAEFLAYLSEHLDLPPPQSSPFNVPEERQYWLFFLPVPP